MAETKIRSIRVPDKVWDHAVEVAQFHDTTVSAMVVDFLRKVNLRGHPKVTAARQATAQVGPTVFGNQQLSGKNLVNLRRPERERMNPLICDHPVIKTIPYGTFCTACGIRRYPPSE